MKKLLLATAIFLAACTFTPAQIAFQHGTWAQILALASQQGKLVFVDGYTSWCGPCKVMAAKTFTDPDVAAFYNAHFINAKIDMEKGDGPSLVEQYDVRAFPTLLFVASSGELVHKVVGALNPALFLALGNEVADPHFATIALARADFAAHQDDRHAQAQYIARMTETYQNVDAVMAKFRPSMAGAGLLDADSWTVFKACFPRIESDEARYFLAHHAAFVRKFGALEADQKLLEIYCSTMGHATYAHDEATYMATRADFLKSGHPEAEKMVAFQDLEWYLGANDWDHVIAAAYRAVSIDPNLPPHVLCSMADLFYKGATQPQDLQAALDWAKKACAGEGNFSNLETQALLLHKLGRSDEAIALARQAIAQAKETKEPYGEMEDELNAWLEGN
jgi:thioredoxin-related protein